MLNGTEWAIRFKSQSGRGGLVEDILYQNLTGTVGTAIEITMNYHHRTVKPTNSSGQPMLRNLTARAIRLNVTVSWLSCAGGATTPVSEIHLDNARFTGVGVAHQSCRLCNVTTDGAVSPKPQCSPAPLPPAASPAKVIVATGINGIGPNTTTLGVVDYLNGESSLVNMSGRLLLVDSVAWCYPWHIRFDHPSMSSCASYIRVRDMASGVVLSNITASCNHAFAAAFAFDGTL